MERYAKYKRKTLYLYLGLGLAAVSLLMIVVSVHEFIHGEPFIVRITGFGAGIMWGIASFLCLKAYYKVNLSELSSLDSKSRSDTK